MLVATRPGPVEVTSSITAVYCRQQMASLNPLTSASPANHPVKRACDACHRRKVKCIGDGTRPCKNCSSAGLTCTYNAVPQKKGPKGSRAKVITELRENQRQSHLTAKLSPDLESMPLSPSQLKQDGLLSTDMITACVDYFFVHMYPTQPILHRQKVGETIGQMETDVEAYCLVVSLCAYMMIQPNMVLPAKVVDGVQMPSQSNLQLGHTLLREALRVRKSADYVDEPSVWSVITSFFLFGSHFCLDKQNAAWFHLREATTMALILGMHEEANYQASDIVESSRRRRLYWLLFITERAYAIQQHKPLTLHATINLPTLEEDPAETVELSGFIHLANLFRPFDDTFVGFWNKSKVGCSTAWLAQLQQQLSAALPQYITCTPSQLVDLRCSQQWLRMMVWQLSISHGFLSSATSDHAMSFQFPIEISRDLVGAASQFSKASMEVHGIGLIEKLFDIACTLTDVMAVIPQERTGFACGPRHYLHQLVNLIGNLRGGQQRYLPILMKKLEDTLPQSASSAYSLSTFPENLRSQDLYEGSQGYSSAPHSGDSTPFGSPLSLESQPYGFPELAPTSVPSFSQDGLAVSTSAPMPIYGAAGSPGHSHEIKFKSVG